MSEQIIAAAFNDPMLGDLRAQVGQKDDHIPYLLLPVKIETRFMKVDRPVKEKDAFANVLNELSLVEDYIHFDPSLMPEHEVAGRVKNIAVKLNELEKSVAEIRNVSPPDKEVLLREINLVEKQNNTLTRHLSAYNKGDDAARKQLLQLRQQVNGALKSTLAAIDSLQPSDIDTVTGNSFRQKLEDITGALQNIAEKKLQVKDRKEKRQIFAFTDKQLKIVEEGLNHLQTEVNVSMIPDEQEMKKIESLTEQFYPLKEKALKNLQSLNSRYKSAEYNDRLSFLEKKYQSMHQDIRDRIMPKIRMMRSLRRTDARALLAQIHILRSYLKKHTRKSFGNYEEIRGTRKQLYEKLHALRKAAHRVIEGSDEEIDAIHRAWDEADRDLEKFTLVVKAYRTADEGERAGLTRTVTHINDEYRKDLNGLKTGSKSAFSKLSNLALEKSAIASEQALRRINELADLLKNSGSRMDAIEEVETFSKSFEAIARDIQILPHKFYTELQNAASRLDEQVTRSAETMLGGSDERLKTEFVPKITEAGKTIRETVDAQVSDSVDRKDRFYDDERSAIVFAARTITRDELWVRFYPDDIAIHTHEEGLTPAEAEAGKSYWYEIWAAGEDQDLRLAAWRAIATSYGSQRAAWIVRAMEPKETDNKTIRDTLLKSSAPLIDVNGALTDLNNLLIQGKGGRNVFEALGQGYPVLNNILEKIKLIEKDNKTLLLKTHKLLLKVQSHINGFITVVKQMNEAERQAAGSRLRVLQEFINTFNSVTQKFQSIGKVTSAEVIRSAPGKVVFPDVPLKETSWTVAPHSRVMPGRFAVITMRNGVYQHIKLGNPLPADQLVVGLDPDTFESGTFSQDEDGNMVVDESIKWLTDFNEAVNKGMAVSITLTPDDLAQGFDKIFVLGIKDTSATEGKKLLEDLIDNHHFIPEGASFLPVGTPTNNTQSGTSGYRKFEEDAALSFLVERNNELPLTVSSDPDFPTDAERLAGNLGISEQVFHHLDYSGRTEISEALLMNKALFHGTLGNYMEEGLDSLFTLDNINHTKAFFNNFVSARGFLPSLRVGTQPYGILPTTAFSRFSVTANDLAMPQLTKEDFDNYNNIQDELQLRFDIRLKELLSVLDSHWTSIRDNKVLYTGNTDPNDPQAHFMEMLGLQATSAEYFYRYGVNVASRQGTEDISINFNSTDPWSPVKVAETFRNQIFSGYYYKSDSFYDEHGDIASNIDKLNYKFSRISDQFLKARVFAMRHLQDQSQILGHLIDNRELTEEIIAATNPNIGTAEEKEKAKGELQNYINWLLTQNPWDIQAENRFLRIDGSSLIEGQPSKSLLFLLLRHSLLSAYADTILKILEFEHLTDQETRKKMGTPKHYYQRYSASFTYVTKWTYLFSEIGRLNYVLGYEMNPANSFYNYMNSLSGTGNGYLNRYLSPEHTFVFNNYPNHASHQRFMDELNVTRNAISKLKDIPTARLEKLLAEHIDLCTYRLDAWRLGMVNKRLAGHRTTHASGIYLGAFGWVEDLKKGGALTPAPSIPSGLWKSGDAQVFTDADNLGFIHTPSLNHAITAAILRAGFHANEATAETENQMAVNLSSERVRTALNLINGIRSGQDAASLLGYQFERGLHERYLHIPLELDQYIYDFRDEFPMSVPVDDSLSLGDAAVNQVVNGMELLETAQEFVASQGGPLNLGDSLYQSLKAFEAAWWASLGNANLSSASAAKKDAMLKEIDRMADAFDALGDLCISESIYQVAKGNHIRAAAIMDKLAKGDVPNDIEIADTPRTGTVVTHKFGMFFEVIKGIDHALTTSVTVPVMGAALNAAVASADAAPPGWNAPFTPRAIAEPTLNKWAGRMIGDPARIKCLVEYSLEEVIVPVTVSLADLKVQPLDVLHLFGTGPLDGGAELNARISAFVRKNIVMPPGSEQTADDLLLNIRYTTRDNLAWTAADHSFYEKAGYIQSLRGMITNSAAIGASDLLIPGAEEVPANEIRNVEVDELMLRVTNLQARLQIAHDDLNDFFTNEISVENAPGHTFTIGQIDSLRTLLERATDFGLPGTVPGPVVSYSDSIGLSLLNAADGAYKAIDARLSQAAAEVETGKNIVLTHDVRVKALTEAARKLIGKAFVILPQFKLRNASDITAQLTLDKSLGLLRAAELFAMEEWFHGLGRVRQRLSLLDTIQMWVENFGGALPGKEVVQFPFALDETGVATDHWLGIEFPENYEPSGDKLSLILMNAAPVLEAPGEAQAALLIDEWVEIIPNKQETTGITFNYDQPDAKAPNTLLLAVTPKETGSWSWDDLVYTLNDTLELAKNRAVEPEHLDDTVFGQLLPALLTEIVPPQLLPPEGDDSSDAQNNPLGLQVVTDFGVNNDTYLPENEDA